jgi:hypothetical protein
VLTGCFWRAVVLGTDRLTPAEDRLVWDWRAAGESFDAIAAALVERRRARAERMRAVGAIAHARRWREQYRREDRA